MKYRIEINIRQDGQHRYSPQVRKNFWTGWENIFQEGNRYFRSNLISCSYSHEESAITAIEQFKIQQQEKKLSKIVKTEYKNYEQ